MAAIALHGGTGVSRVAGVAGHDGAAARVNGGLEGHELVLLQRTLGGVEAPLTLGGVGLEAVLSGTVAGEVLDGQGDSALLHAALAVLVTLDQRGDDAGGDFGTLGKGLKVARPAGVGDKIDLGAVHRVDALGDPHLAVYLGIVADRVIVAIAHRGGSQTLRVGEAGGDGVGDDGHGDGGHTALGGVGLGHLGDDVVVERDGGGVKVQSAAVHAGAHLLGVDDEGVKPREAGGISVLGLLTLAEDGDDGGGVDAAVLVLGHVELGHARGDGEGVEHEARLILEAHLADHVSRALLGVQAPVLKGVELLVVVAVLEVETLGLDHTHGGDADGGAALVFIEHGLQIGRGRIDLGRIVRSGDVGVALGEDCGRQAQQQRQHGDDGNEFLHFPFSLY